MRKINPNGFTFFEVILYLAIATMVVGIFFSFGWNIVSARVKSATCRETRGNAILISERIKQELRRSESINRDESVFGETPGKIVFNTSDGEVTIEAIEDRIRIQRENADPIYLSGDRIKVRDFFLKNSVDSEEKINYIGFSFSAEAYYAENQKRFEYQCSIPVNSGVAPRNR
jgi:hypothetical protein